MFFVVEFIFYDLISFKETFFFTFYSIINELSTTQPAQPTMNYIVSHNPAVTVNGARDI